MLFADEVRQALEDYQRTEPIDHVTLSKFSNRLKNALHKGYLSAQISKSMWELTDYDLTTIIHVGLAGILEYRKYIPCPPGSFQVKNWHDYKIAYWKQRSLENALPSGIGFEDEIRQS